MEGNRFLLLYGSQTGQAQAIGEEIQDRCGQEGLYADLHCLSNVDKKVFCVDFVHCSGSEVYLQTVYT